MNTINLLSSSLGQKDSNANLVLAKDIAEKENKNAIKELVDNLNNKDKKIQADCIKTLYETAYIKPELIADYHADFLGLLTSKNNRMVWGAMIALKTITGLKYKEIFAALDLISDTMSKGSVITIDCGVEILAKLNKYKEYNNTIESLLTDQLWQCPIKQLPQYMEKSLVSITKHNKEIFQKIITERKHECVKNSQVNRLNRILKIINSI